LVDYVEVWGARLLEEVHATLPFIRHVVCGFGTGATVVGLHRVFTPAGLTVAGLQAPAGYPIPGWRNFERQNLGAQDLFFRFRGDVLLDTAPAAPGIASSGLAALRAHVSGHAHPEQVLVISHDGCPAACPETRSRECRIITERL
jgi:cysteine synthase B